MMMHNWSKASNSEWEIESLWNESEDIVDKLKAKQYNKIQYKLWKAQQYRWSILRYYGINESLNPKFSCGHNGHYIYNNERLSLVSIYKT